MKITGHLKFKSSAGMGFSLIEFLIASSITFVVLFGATSLTSKILQRNELSSTVRLLLAALNSHQSLAVLEGSAHKIKFDQANNKVMHLRENEESKQATKTLLTFPKNIRITFVSFGNLSDPTLLVFNPTGTTTPGSVSLSNNYGTCSIIQSLYGARRTVCT